MSKVREYLEAKRREQIATMQGDSAVAAPEELLAEAQAQSKAAARYGGRSKLTRAYIKISSHASRRMSQRGRSLADVLLLWRNGEVTPQSDGRVVHSATRNAIDLADGVERSQMRAIEGEAIVVDPGSPPVLVTYLADGRDTRHGAAPRSARRSKHRYA